MSNLVVGQKVKAKCNLIEDACGDHPALLYAKKGDELYIRRISPNTAYPLTVSHEYRPNDGFGCKESEVQEI